MRKMMRGSEVVMSKSKLVEIPTVSGKGYVDPDEVVAIIPQGEPSTARCYVQCKNNDGRPILCTKSVEDIKLLLNL